VTESPIMTSLLPFSIFIPASLPAETQPEART
jgi:hypothetical protein